MPHKRNQIPCSVFALSMSAYQRRSQEEEKIARLEQRRSRLRAMLQEEEQRHDAELKELRALEGQRLQEKEAIRSAREDRRKEVCHFSALLKRCIALRAKHLFSLPIYPQHVGGLLNDCWGENNSEVPKVSRSKQKWHRAVELPLAHSRLCFCIQCINRHSFPSPDKHSIWNLIGLVKLIFCDFCC